VPDYADGVPLAACPPVSLFRKKDTGSKLPVAHRVVSLEVNHCLVHNTAMPELVIQQLGRSDYLSTLDLQTELRDKVRDDPTTEYLSGGAEKLELVCHFDANNNPDPIILDYWCAGHYAGGASCHIPAGEEWNKVIGPIFVYCNALADPKVPSPADLATLEATAGNPTVPPAWHDNATTLFADALAQAKIEKARWPYDWVNGVDYPHKDQRGNVTGQLVLNDPQAATTKLPHLTVGLAHPDYPGGSTRAGNNGIVTWPHDGNYYKFWTDGSDDGRFTITNVRPGTYTLHAFADGVLGEFARTDITVAAGQAIDLGKLEWKPVRYGKQVWEIGYPDRTGDKFFKGDAANYWL